MSKKQPKVPSKAPNGIVVQPKFSFLIPETSQESLAQISSAREQLSDIQKHLRAVIDAVHDNPSLLNRASISWGVRPLWQKITGSVLVFGTLFTLGILAHLIMLIVIGGIIATVFSVSSYLLEEHYKTSKRSKESLNAGILNLAKILELTIGALDEIRQQLAVEINRFQRENHRFTENISKLDIEVSRLCEEIKQLTATKESFNLIKDRLTLLTEAYEVQNVELGKKIADLAVMGREVKTLTETSAFLRGTVEQLLPQLTRNKTQIATFLSNMESALLNGSAIFKEVALQISEERKALSVVQAALSLRNLELERNNKIYRELLDIQEPMVNQLKKLLDEGIFRNDSSEDALKKQGAWMAMFPKHRTLPKEKTSPLSPLGAGTIFN